VNSEPNQSARPITTRSRIVALVFGPLYLLQLAAVSWSITRTSPWLNLLLILAGATLIMAVLVVFGIKAYDHRGPTRRFGLATIFLVMVPLSIYLAWFRWLMSHLPDERFTIAAGIAASVVFVLMVILTTVVLLWLAEALMWLSVLLLYYFRQKQRYEREPPDH
jgi:hypothetical protein